MTAAIEILVVDDEAHLRAMLADYFGQYGIVVRELDGGTRLIDEVSRRRPDLVLLDVNMPGEDGFTHLRRLRGVDPDLPVIMLTAAARVDQRIGGLEGGADDYVVKPFDIRELLARMRAVLERSSRGARAVPPPGYAAFGPHSVDFDGRRLLDPSGNEIALTALEFDLVALFARNPRKVFTRARLRSFDHRVESADSDRAIDIRVTRIRKKVETDPRRPMLIRTVRGQGYVYDPTEVTPEGG